MKNIIFIAALILKSAVVLAQQETEATGHRSKIFKYYFNGAVGFYFPFGSVNALKQTGDVTAFQFEIDYKDNWFSRICFDQYDVGYEDRIQLNGLNTYINDKVSTMYIGLDIGYQFNKAKKLSGFLYGGGGFTSMNVPIARYDNVQNNLEITNSMKSFLGVRCGLGLAYTFSRIFILYSDIQYLTIPFKTELSNKQLKGVSLQIGFKTPLQ
jgi:hypothetical protein